MACWCTNGDNKKSAIHEMKKTPKNIAQWLGDADGAETTIKKTHFKQDDPSPND